ncbi:MAG: hypothetical protein WCP19_11210, partial [Chloroflexota bacterium]
TFIPYLPAYSQIIKNVFGHTGDIGLFGFSRILPVYYTVPIFGIVMLLLPFLSKYVFDHSINEAFLISSLGFVVLAPGFYAHYLIIPLLSGALLPSISYLFFSVISIDTIFRYHQLGFIPIILEPLTWLYSAIYLGSFFLVLKNRQT